jgi:acyl carrier protein
VDKHDFLKCISETMQLEVTLTGDEVLDAIEEWDSLAILSLMSMFDLKVDDLRSAKTVDDLIILMHQKGLDS